MNSYIRLMLFGVLMFLTAAVPYGALAKNVEDAVKSSQFKEYWYGGTAEITSYDLEQARYGELHEGYAVLVYVTEDFSQNKQVKLDNPSAAGGDAVKILKLNFVKKFDTGIYRYSMMNSVFTPVGLDQYPNTLKVSSSSQEWCGHTYTQLNLDGADYKVTQFSYFESEGDNDYDVETALLEDEIWTRIRIAPDSLPVGDINIVPGTMSSRLTHRPLKVESASATLKEDPSQKDIITYTLEYGDTRRRLSINFEKEFPHEITSWEEQYVSGFGDNKKVLSTKAVKKKTLITDYWNQNKPVDRELRNKLGI